MLCSDRAVNTKALPVPRLRIVFDGKTAFGPGKAELLEAILETGSIAAAGRQLGMSYRRAWLLVDELNRMFTEKVVITAKGGKRGGGAKLTPTGENVLSLYRRMESIAFKKMTEELTKMQRLTGSSKGEEP